MSEGIRVRMIGGPYNGLEFELPEGAITDPGTPIALPFSHASDSAGLEYVVYIISQTPNVAKFEDYAGLTISPRGDASNTSGEE